MTPTNIPLGLLVNAQANLNPKVQFDTLAELANLGTNDILTVTYYNNMLVYCVENKTWYIWREKLAPTDSVGVVVGDYTYPANYVSFGIIYSSKVYNFFTIHNAKNITPSGVITVRKISTNVNEEVLEAGDYVVNTVLTNEDYLIWGKYVAGDPLVEGSYAQGKQIMKPA